MANLIVSAVSTFDNKGLKKASKEISVFDKQVKSLGKTFASVFAVSALLNYSKKAIAAFSADEAAAKSLEVQLRNTGYAFSAPDIEYYIANLQNLTKVLDDNLRPAFQTLLTATGSITESQKALQVALDTSAATGMSLESVSSVLAAGYRGQTKSLKTLGVTLSATALKAGHMAEALTEIGTAYSGQAKARLETFAGQVDAIKVSSANAQEIIGKGFTDAFAKLGNSKDIAKLGSAMEKVATTIANIVVALGAVLGKVVSIGKAIFEKLHLDKIIGFLYSNSLVNLLSKFGASQTDQPTSNFTYSLGSGAGVELARIQELKARKALNAQLAKELALKKLQEKYDLERIRLMAALGQATDEETKTRLAEKLAILDGDASLVNKYEELSIEMNLLANSTSSVTNAFNNTAAAILTAGQKIAYSLGVSPSQIGTGGAIIAQSPGSVGPSLSNAGGLASVAINQGMLGTTKEAIDLSISLGFTNTSNITDALTRAVAESLMINNKNGLPTTPAGFL